MTNSNPIGIFDSGVGGLSVARSIRKELPNENLLYIADSFHSPYGDKPQELIEQRASILTNFLLQKGAKMIVVACNTATVATIQKMRLAFSIPIIGVEPGVKPATYVTQSGIIGVMATEQTVNSTSFKNLVCRFCKNFTVEVQPCPDLAEQVEKMNLNGKETADLIKRYVFPLLDKGVDTIVMGCTHYAFLTPLIQKIAGSHIKIINTQTAVAKETARRLHVEGLLSPDNTEGHELFWTSGKTKDTNSLFSLLWGAPVSVSPMSTLSLPKQHGGESISDLNNQKIGSFLNCLTND